MRSYDGSRRDRRGLERSLDHARRRPRALDQRACGEQLGVARPRPRALQESRSATPTSRRRRVSTTKTPGAPGAGAPSSSRAHADARLAPGPGVEARDARPPSSVRWRGTRAGAARSSPDDVLGEQLGRARSSGESASPASRLEARGRRAERACSVGASSRTCPRRPSCRPEQRLVVPARTQTGERVDHARARRSAARELVVVLAAPAQACS